MSDQPSISIIGAGPGGLTCARVLQLAGIDVAVFDADVSLAARDQGGTLDLHADSGQIALEDAHLTHEFADLARPEGQSHRLMDPTGMLVREQIADPDETAAPEIDRAQLRGLLADSLLPGTIRWGRRVTRAVPAAPAAPGERRGGHVLHLADGTRTAADIVIGADGAWSRVRTALTDAMPVYTGVSFVEVLFTETSSRHPEIAELVGDGHLWANGDGRTIVLQRSSGDVIRGYLGMRVELDWLARAGLGAADGRGGLLPGSPRLDANAVQTSTTSQVEDVRAAVRERFSGFAPGLLKVIERSEGILANRPIMALPTPTRWRAVPGLTLLGDAAHVMAPFGGNGVNLAMLEGAELGRGIAEALGARAGATEDSNGSSTAAAVVDAPSQADAAIRRYERTMIPRGARIGAAANTAIREHFAVGGPDPDAIPVFEEFAAEQRRSAEEYRSQRGTS